MGSFNGWNTSCVITSLQYINGVFGRFHQKRHYQFSMYMQYMGIGGFHQKRHYQTSKNTTERNTLRRDMICFLHAVAYFSGFEKKIRARRGGWG